MEHLLAAQKQRTGTLLLRSADLTPGKTRIGLRDLAYYLQRFPDDKPWA